MIIKAPGGTVTVPCRVSRPPQYTLVPPRAGCPPCPCASQGLAGLQPAWLHGSLFPLPSLGTVLGLGAAEGSCREGMEEGTETPQKPCPLPR